MLIRNRRLRSGEAIRALVRETSISPNDFLVPLFVLEGKKKKEEISSMPNYFRYSLGKPKILCCRDSRNPEKGYEEGKIQSKGSAVQNHAANIEVKSVNP